MRKKLTSRKSGLTRREFVAAAAAASAFSIVPRHVLGGPGTGTEKGPVFGGEAGTRGRLQDDEGGECPSSARGCLNAE